MFGEMVQPSGCSHLDLDLDNGLLSSTFLEAFRTAGDTMRDWLMLRRDGHLVSMASNTQPAKCLINCCDTGKGGKHVII